MFDVHLFEAKNRVFQFNYRKDEQVRVRLMSKKLCSSSFNVRYKFEVQLYYIAVPHSSILYSDPLLSLK